jgi:hypothetical protein
MELPIFRPNVNLVCPRFQEGLAPRMMLTAARGSAVGRLIVFRRHWLGLNISGGGLGKTIVEVQSSSVAVKAVRDLAVRGCDVVGCRGGSCRADFDCFSAY